MKNLLLDIGNSDIKIASAINGKTNVKLLKRFSYSKKKFERDLTKELSELYNPKFVNAGISVQDNSKRIILKRIIKKKFNLNPVFIERKSVQNLKIDYSEGLGIDRICNAVAAKEIYRKKNMLVTDFGTATTFTFISEGILKGGLICPGMNTSRDALSANTKLPAVNVKLPDRLYYSNTIDNIRAGIYFQSFYSVKGIIKEFKKEFKDLFVITTGGLSKFFKAEKIESDINDINLTLKGINFIISQ